MTSPPKRSTLPSALSNRVPSTKSASEPAAMRRGPARPEATQPPRVPAVPKRGGSKASIWPCEASSVSISASGVPARAVSTSSDGS